MGGHERASTSGIDHCNGMAGWPRSDTDRASSTQQENVVVQGVLHLVLEGLVDGVTIQPLDRLTVFSNAKLVLRRVTVDVRRHIVYWGDASEFSRVLTDVLACLLCAYRAPTRFFRVPGSSRSMAAHWRPTTPPSGTTRG